MDRRGSPWTLSEDFALMGMIHHARPSTIARRLGRTERAIIRRMERLGLAVTTDGVVTSGEASRLTGLSPQYLTHLARQGRIRAHRKPGGRWWCFDPVSLIGIGHMPRQRVDAG